MGTKLDKSMSHGGNYLNEPLSCMGAKASQTTVVYNHWTTGLDWTGLDHDVI